MCFQNLKSKITFNGQILSRLKKTALEFNLKFKLKFNLNLKVLSLSWLSLLFNRMQTGQCLF